MPAPLVVVVRERLPDERQSVTRKFHIRTPDGDEKIYVHVGLYADGRPGELFLTVDKAGSLARGAIDAVAMSISVGLQHGVPLGIYTAKLRGMRFDPAGLTGDPAYPQVASVLDLVARWLDDRFSTTVTP